VKPIFVKVKLNKKKHRKSPRHISYHDDYVKNDEQLSTQRNMLNYTSVDFGDLNT
jgi:hypothetical protein